MESVRGKKVSVLILAAGFSKRMGEFKPLLPIGEKSALERLIDAYRQAGVADIFVVTGHNREALQPVIKKAGVKEVFNKDFATGMFSSVKAGINAVVEGGGKATGLLMHPVDTPLVGASVIRDFIDGILEGQTDPPTQGQTRAEMFAVTCFMGKKGHPLYIPEKFFSEILAYDGDRGLKGITSKYDYVMYRYETGDESVILDMDTKEEYKEILSFYGEGRTGDLGQGRGLSGGEAGEAGLVGEAGLAGEAGEKFGVMFANRRFVFVRHGEIRQHKEKIFLGQYDPPLSDRGKDQAREAGEALLKLGRKPETDRIYTSDLLRARETALIIKGLLGSKGVLGLELVEEAGFREMSLGGWDGQYISRIKADFPEAYERRGENLLTFKIDSESENYFDLRYRAWKSLEKILEEDKNKDIIIVSHGGTMRALLSILKGTTLEEEMKTPIKNGEIIVLDSTV